MGGTTRKNLAFKDTKDFVSRMVKSVPGLDFETLKQKGFYIKKRPSAEISKAFPRVNIYSKTLESEGLSPLPEYIPVTHPERENEFAFTAFKSNLGLDSTANSKWAREILHENRLWINRKTAEKMNIKNGDKVRVTSSAGNLVVRALPTDRIHPRSVAMVEGLGHTAVGRVATARKFKSSDLDTNLIWWSKAGCGVNPKTIIENKHDAVGGGSAPKETLVRVEKV